MTTLPGIEKAATRPVAATAAAPCAPFTIRPLTAADRAPVHRLILATGVFAPAEVEVALELIDVYLTRPEQKDYCIYSIVDATDVPAGYVCFGPTPCTEGTWDLYWIAVDPAAWRHKLGSRLLEFSETTVRGRKARMMVIETSSQPRYEGTRAFYTKNEYVELARLKDFYFVGDDKVIFGKRFDS
ncbi:MAG: GNAT family N-acetyltransferase [Planctomycetes bacterium]|nr:GNAT family N-acetyltransferase [Planctomycetota bacterium]